MGITNKMSNQNEFAALHSTDIIENVGVIADGLVTSCRLEPDSAGDDMRGLLERALIVAAEAPQQGRDTRADQHRYHKEPDRDRFQLPTHRIPFHRVSCPI